MAQYSMWILEESNITISNGAILDGVTQGDATHLLGETITLDSNAWLEVLIDDSEGDFQDSDNSQTLDGDQTIDGIAGTDGTRVEGEYQVTVTDGTNTYTMVGFNLNESSPSYGTVEGLSFIGGPGGFPPIGVPLTVVSVSEGPGSGDTAYSDYASPICLTLGTYVETPDGRRLVEDLKSGDLVRTLDHGDQPIRWIGRNCVNTDTLKANPSFRPVRLRRNALGPDLPDRDMLLSQQHRVLIRGVRAQLYFGEDEVLVAAKHLINDHSIGTAFDVDTVTYFHFLFDNHEIIFADGIETESFLPGPAAIQSVSPEALDELFDLFPELRCDEFAYGPPTRPVLSGREGRLLA